MFRNTLKVTFDVDKLDSLDLDTLILEELMLLVVTGAERGPLFIKLGFNFIDYMLTPSRPLSSEEHCAGWDRSRTYG